MMYLTSPYLFLIVSVVDDPEPTGSKDSKTETVDEEDDRVVGVGVCMCVFMYVIVCMSIPLFR